MNYLSDEQKNKLKDAISEVVSDAVDNMNEDPNMRIVKTAQSLHLTEDYIPIIVRAYNTAVQGCVRDSGKTIQEKTASFPLASTEKINSILFGSNKKAEYSQWLPPDDGFSFKADCYFGKPYADKVVYDDIPLQKSAGLKRNVDRIAVLEENLNEKTARLKEEVRRDLFTAEHKLDNAISEFGATLKRVDAPNDATLFKFASLVFGDEGIAAVVETKKRFNLLEKRGGSAVPISTESVIYNQLKAIVDLNNACFDAQDDLYKTAEYCFNALRPIAKRRLDSLYPEDDAKALLARGEEYARGVEKYAAKLPNIKLTTDDDIAALLDPSTAGLGDQASRIVNSLNESVAEEQLRNIDTTTSLAMALSTDPVLAKKDPEEVMEAFDEVSRLLPDNTSKTVLVQAMRDMLETGGMDIGKLNSYSMLSKGMGETQRSAVHDFIRGQYALGMQRYKNQAQEKHDLQRLLSAAQNYVSMPTRKGSSEKPTSTSSNSISSGPPRSR